MSSWISVKDKLPHFDEETVVFFLLKDGGLGYWLPARYDQLLEKAWWIPQRETFVYVGIEDALHMITHWQPFPLPPKDE
ncbi:MAG: DUF551 domain-containing protein [Prolixibacteraceae bacterium]